MEIPCSITGQRAFPGEECRLELILVSEIHFAA